MQQRVLTCLLAITCAALVPAHLLASTEGKSEHSTTAKTEDTAWPPKSYTGYQPLVKKQTSAVPEETVKFAIENLNTENTAVFEKSAYVFEQMGSDAIPVLVTELRNNKHEEKIRVNTLYILGRLGKTSQNAVFFISSFLRSDDPQTRAVAAMALGKIGPKASAVLEVLNNLRDDKDKWVRDSAAEAIDRINASMSRQVSSVSKAN